MSRFLLMLPLLLLLLPGAELATSNIDEVEPFTSATLGAQFSMAVTPKTTLQKPSPASHGPTNKAALPKSPHARDSKSKPRPPKESSVKSVRIQPVQEDTTASETNTTLHRGISTSYETRRPETAKSHLPEESRKGPTPAIKAKAVVKPNKSSRYQSLPLTHHKNHTSKTDTVQLKNSSVTTAPKPQQTVATPLRNTFQPGQRGDLPPSDKVKHLPLGLQGAMQMSRGLKERTSNTSQLLNALVNQNFSFTNSIQHMAVSSNSTFTTVKKLVPHELNSLHSQDLLRNLENVTSVPNVNGHNDASRMRLFGRVDLPVEHDSRVMQELKSKVKVRIPEKDIIYNHMNLNLRDDIFSTEQPGLVQEGKGHLQQELTTQVLGGTKQLDTSTLIERTSDISTYSNGHSHGNISDTEVYTQVMIGENAHHHKEKKQTRLTTTAGQQIARNQTHLHKHRHTGLDQFNLESNAISQHNATVFDRTANLEPHVHHSKHLHNNTHLHSHNHHKHRSDHHTQRNHISQTQMHLNMQEQSDVATHALLSQPQHHTDFVTPVQKKTSNSTTPIQQSQSRPSQFHTDSVTPNQTKTSIQNNTHANPKLLEPSFQLEALQENQLNTQRVDIHSELTTQALEQTTLYPQSLTNSPAAHKLNNLGQSTQSEVYQHLHTEWSTSFAKYGNTQTTGHSITTNYKHILTTKPQSLTTLEHPEIHPTQDELATPMQNTIKYQHSQPTLATTTEPAGTFQTHPELITQTLPDLGKANQSESSTQNQSKWSPWTEQDLITSGPSEWSTHRLEKKPPVLPTVTTPLLVAQSQSEPATQRSPDLAIYYNATNSFIDSGSGITPHTEPITDRIYRSTYTEKTTNGPTKPKTQRNGTTKSTNQTAKMINNEIKSEFSTQMEPVAVSRTDSVTHIQPTTASTEAETTTKSMITDRHESTTEMEPVPQEADTLKQTPSTTKSPTKPFTQIVATARHSTHFTANTKQVTNYDMQRTTTIAFNTESGTQTMVTNHSWDDIQPTSQREPTIKTPFKPTAYYQHETTTDKEPVHSIQPDIGTLTYSQQTMGTKLELIKNAEQDQATETYMPTERTLMPGNTSVSGESRAAWTAGYNGNTQNGSDNFRTTPARGVEAFHPTSVLPSGKHHSHDPATTVKIYGPRAPSSTKSVTSPASSTFTPQTLGELMSVQPGRDRIFIVEEQQPLFKVPTINVTHRVTVPTSVTCDQPDKCKSHLIEEVTSAYMAAPGFSRIDILNATLAGGVLEYKVLLGVRVGTPLTAEQELVLTNPTSLFDSPSHSGAALLSAVHNASLAEGPADPCIDWLSCPRGFHCVPQRKLSALCLSPCHSAFCQNDGICIHRKGLEPACQCPVGADFWYMGPTCDYRMTHHRLAAIACAVVFCIIICAAAAVFILVRRFQTQILQQKVAQTQSSYRRFSRFDDVPTHFWCPSQTWLTTSASLNSLDNPAFSSSEEVFPLQALGSCVCGCQNGARASAPTNPPEQATRGPPRLETSLSSVNELMIDSGKASDVSVCSWPMEPIHWTPFPILHQLSLQSPFHARRPHSYFEGMELVNTERSWTA